MKYTSACGLPVCCCIWSYRRDQSTLMITSSPGVKGCVTACLTWPSGSRTTSITCDMVRGLIPSSAQAQKRMRLSQLPSQQPASSAHADHTPRSSSADSRSAACQLSIRPLYPNIQLSHLPAQPPSTSANGRNKTTLTRRLGNQLSLQHKLDQDIQLRQFPPLQKQH